MSRPHTDDCKICVHFAKCRKGGRPNKSQKKRDDTSNCDIHLICSWGVPRHSSDQSLYDFRLAGRPSHVVCPLCNLVMNRPVQLTYERLVCAECIIQMLLSKGPSACYPSCGAPATSVHFGKCPSVVADLFGNLGVKYGQGCLLSFPLRQLANHEECCTPYVSPPR